MKDGYICGEMKNKYILKNIHNYNSSKEYYVLYNLSYYLLIKEIVEILIKLFPNEIIESTKSNVLEKE